MFFLGLWCAVGLSYLSNAHQRILQAPLPARAAQAVALVLGGLALAAGWRTLGAAVACLGGLAWTQLWLGLWPLASLLSPSGQGQGRRRAGRWDL